MIDVKTLKQLVRLMKDNELTELDLEGEGEKVRLRRAGEQPAAVPMQPVASAPPPPAAAPPAPAAPAAAEPEEPGVTINSPMVGSFYSASSPDAKPFVQVGSQVEPDTVVCVIEAMKVFNEIKAETSGTITEVLVSNGAAVEYDQPLFRVKPK